MPLDLVSIYYFVATTLHTFRIVGNSREKTLAISWVYSLKFGARASFVSD